MDSEQPMTVLGADHNGELIILHLVHGHPTEVPLGPTGDYAPWTLYLRAIGEADAINQAMATHAEWSSPDGPIGATGSVAAMARLPRHVSKPRPVTPPTTAPAPRAPWWAPWRRR